MWATIIYFVVTLVLTIALAPRPPTVRAATLTDFTLPTADQGRPIPVVFGQVLITGPNCVWYGDLATVANKVHSLFSSTTVGFYYHLGFQLVLGHGPFDAINKIFWDLNLTWQGNTNGNGSVVPLTSDGNACMYFPDLFGGAQGAGGVTGCFNISFGAATNSPNAYLQSVLGTVPNFRGVTSAIYVGGNRTMVDNFTQSDLSITTGQSVQVGYIGTSPYVRGVAFDVTRIQQGWNIAGGCWYSAKAAVASNQAVEAPPSWEPTFDDSLLGPIGPTVTHIQFTNPTSGGNKNWQIGVQGYILIGTEWMRINTLETYVPGSGQYKGQTILNGYMDVTRGCFGTTPGSYAQNTAYQVYLTTTTPVSMMNPAHIVYQCLTDPKWGMGLPVSALDNTVFQAAADVFYAEGMGLCMQWVNASTCQDFLKIVLDHCAANLVMNNTTGLLQLIPIRGGYNVSTLPTYDETTIVSLDEFSTQAWADEVNEVVLVYTDPATCKDTAITGQDISNLDVQGKIVSQTLQYQGIKDHVLAAAVLGRELSARCTPLVKVKFKVNRNAWGTTLGGLFKLNWADRDVTGLIFRVAQVSSGKLEANTLTIDAVQDIYSLGLYNYQVTTSQPPKATQTYPGLKTPPASGGPTVLSSTQTTPPAAPSDGDRYLVPAGATGAWQNEGGNVAIWDAGTQTWSFVSVPQGVLVYDQSSQSYMTTDATGDIVQSSVGQQGIASGIKFDDSQAHLGATNVQDAIDALAKQLASSINLAGYAQGLWFGDTLDGTKFTSPDLQNWTTQPSSGSTQLNNLVYDPTSGLYLATLGNEIGYAPAADLWTTWTWQAVGTAEWQGLKFFPATNQLVVWQANVINVSTNGGQTWTDPTGGSSYASVIGTDTPLYWLRFGDDSNSLFKNSGSWPGNANALGGASLSGVVRTVSGLVSGSADALDCMQGGSNLIPVPAEPSEFPEILTGTEAFSIELWMQGSVSGQLALFSKNSVYSNSTNNQDTCSLTWDPVNDSSKITFRTGVLNATTGAVIYGMSCKSSAVALTDGNIHHVVATRDTAGNAAIYVDGVQVGSATGQPVDDVTTVKGGYIYAGEIFMAGIIPVWPTGVQSLSEPPETVIDECALYSTALSQARVTAHYNAGISGLRGTVSIIDIEYDAQNGRYLIFANVSGVAVGGGNSVTQAVVFQSTNNLASMTNLARISQHATDNVTLTSVAFQSAAQQLSSSEQYLFNFGMNDPVDGTGALILRYVFWSSSLNLWFGFRDQIEDLNGITAYDKYWNYDPGQGYGIGNNFWASVQKYGNLIYGVWPHFGDATTHCTVFHLDTGAWTSADDFVPNGTVGSFYDVAISPTGKVWVCSEGGGSGTGQGSIQGIANLNPTTMVPIVNYSRTGTNIILKYTCDDTNIYALATPSTGGWTTQIEVISQANGSVVADHALDPTDLGSMSNGADGAVDILLVGSYFYVYVVNQGGVGGYLTRYNASTFAKDTSWTAVPLVTTSRNNVAGRKVLFADGNFLQVGQPTEAVIDLTTPSSPIIYRTSNIGVLYTLNNVQVLATSGNGGTAWAWPNVSYPSQSKPQPAQCIWWDGARFVMMGLGWSGTSSNLSSWTFSTTGGMPAGEFGLYAYPNGAGTTGVEMSNGSGETGYVWSTDGLNWTNGPKFRGEAADISYDNSHSSLPVSEVQSGLTLLSGVWGILNEQIFGG